MNTTFTGTHSYRRPLAGDTNEVLGALHLPCCHFGWAVNATFTGTHPYGRPLAGNTNEVFLTLHHSHRCRVKFVSLNEFFFALLLLHLRWRGWRTKVASILVAVKRASRDGVHVSAGQLLVRLLTWRKRWTAGAIPIKAVKRAYDIRFCGSLVRGGDCEDNRCCGWAVELVLDHACR